jgi:archaemetzincin
MKKILILLLLVFIANGYKVSYNKKNINEKLTINITTMGNVDASTVDFIKNEIKKFYKADIILLPNTKILYDAKLNEVNKYSGNLLLKIIDSLYVKEKHKVLLVTNYDICTDRELNGKVHKNWSVLGLAYLKGKPAVVSTYRIKNRDRLSKVSIHEIGHTLGIPHCQNTKCVMVDAKGKASNIDKATLWMCDDCRLKIKY